MISAIRAAANRLVTGDPAVVFQGDSGDESRHIAEISATISASCLSGAQALMAATPSAGVLEVLAGHAEGCDALF